MSALCSVISFNAKKSLDKWRCDIASKYFISNCDSKGSSG